MEHTETPWVYESGSIYKLSNKIPSARNEEDKKIRLILADREEIYTSPAERDENLRYTEKAVNHHDELVSAVGRALSLIMSLDTSPQHDDIIDELDAILGKLND